MAGVYVNENEMFSAIHKLEHPPEIKCPKCQKPMNYTSRPWPKWVCLPGCGSEREYKDENWLAFIDYYNPDTNAAAGTFSRAVILLKYKDLSNTTLQKKFAEKLYQTIDEKIGITNFDFCVSIPNSNGKPNDVIGRVFAHIAGLHYDPTMIVGQPRTSQKKAHAPSARRANVKGKFSLRDPKSVKDEKILLLDDIVTSGASMDEVSKLIVRESGIYVYAGAIGRTRRQ